MIASMIGVAGGEKVPDSKDMFKFFDSEFNEGTSIISSLQSAVSEGKVL